MKTASTLLIGSAGLLLTFGLVMLYSAGLQPSTAAGGTRWLLMQGAWCGLGFVGCAVAAWWDYRKLRNYAWPMLIVSGILLAVVLIPGIGVKNGGARRWFNLGFGHFQPSEVAKFSLILMLAWYVERFQTEIKTFKHGLVIPGVFVGVMLGLIFIEPDRGTTILLAAVGGIMLVTAGVRWRYLLPPALIGTAGLAYSLLHDPVRLKRILSWLDPEAHKDGTGWQGWQGTLALGSGGWTGLGLGNSRQKMGFLPEHHTDFILSIIGEELGLVATLAVLVLFVVLILCGIYIACRAPDTFGLMLGTGITFLIGLQAFINIGVVTGVLPNKGLPLPFISYGGSNLLLMMTCVGVLFSIARHSNPVDELPEPLSGHEIFAAQST